jgi:hypothetical protein
MTKKRNQGKKVFFGFGNKKFEQPLRLLFSDADFLKDCVEAKNKFKQLLVRAQNINIELERKKVPDQALRDSIGEVLHGEHEDVIDQLTRAAKSEKAFKEELEKIELKSYEALVKRIEESLATANIERDRLFSEPAFKKAVSTIFERYKPRYRLAPKDLWCFIISNFILLGKKITPWEFDIPPSVIARFAYNQKLFQLPGNNFGLRVIKNINTKEQELYVRIFKDTSKNDIVNGWNLIDETRKAVLGQGRYYPMKNLNLYERLANEDKESSDVSDYEKADNIFGGDGDSRALSLSGKRKKQLQQVRYRRKKGFGTKS